MLFVADARTTKENKNKYYKAVLSISFKRLFFFSLFSEPLSF